VSDSDPSQGMTLEQQLAYARDLRRIYDSERERRRELEATNRALATANAELDRRLYDLLAAQDWILAVSSSRDLPSMMDLLSQPLVLLLNARGTVVFPWDPEQQALGSALGHGIMRETPTLAALRQSGLAETVLAGEGRWEAPDLDSAAGDGAVDYGVVRALGWRAVVAVPLVARNERVGVLFVGWDTTHQMDERDRMLLDLLASHAAVSLANARLLTESAARAQALQEAEAQQLAYAHDLRLAYESERARRAELQAAYLGTVRVLAAAIETRDPYTGGHVERVAAYAVAIGRELGWEIGRLETLELGALLHDVGKIGVEDRVLRKPGKLEPDELAQMRRHPELGARMLQDVPFLGIVVIGCALRHHERPDGLGYPDGLLGEAIPIEARIVAVADTVDAITSDRPYRKARPLTVAVAEIEQHRGTQFDPEVVAAFMRAVGTGAIRTASGDAVG
jgi:HD-GYP domain-containing protein (c-di-GMP phosphodiesterase class II)